MRVHRAVGVDLGRQDDYTALSIIDRVPVEGGRPEFHVQWLRRLRHVPYTVVADEIAAMSMWPALIGVRFVVDATGVGRAVVDLLRERVPHVEAVTITSGREVTIAPVPHEHGVPKRDLASAMEVALSARRLRVPDKLPEGRALAAELQDFGWTISAAGRDSYAAKGSAHDDLVLSVALACWWLHRDASSGAAGWIELYRKLGQGEPLDGSAAQLSTVEEPEVPAEPAADPDDGRSVMQRARDAVFRDRYRDFGGSR